MPNALRKAPIRVPVAGGRPARGLPPEEALERWSDPDAYAAMMEFGDCADKQTATPEGERRWREYMRRRSAVEDAFLERLRSGTLLASGISRDGDQRKLIRPDLWQSILDVDYESNVIGGQGRIYDDPEFFQPAAIPKNLTKIPGWATALATDAAELPSHRTAVSAPILFAVDGRNVLFSSGAILTGEGANLIRALLPAYDEARNRRLAPADFPFLKAAKLADTLHTNEDALRRRVGRIRKEIQASFETTTGLTIGKDDVIENVRWRGYRLNPHIVRVEPFQLKLVT